MEKLIKIMSMSRTDRYYTLSHLPKDMQKRYSYLMTGWHTTISITQLGDMVFTQQNIHNAKVRYWVLEALELERILPQIPVEERADILRDINNINDEVRRLTNASE